jgi:type IV secretion system protein TrbE
VLMATQSLSDSVNSGILDVIIESTATKIFLPNAYAREEDAAALYRRFGLNDRQIELIAGAVPKRDYYYISERGRRMYELALGPLALAFVGISDKDSVAEVRKCESRYGDGWVDEWLRRRGLSLDRYLSENNQAEAAQRGSEEEMLQEVAA